MSEPTSCSSTTSSSDVDNPTGDPLSPSGGHPLGPLVELSEDRSNFTRLTAVGVFLGTMAILGTALYVQPDTVGVGTHRQLGLSRCGFLVTTGLPCPTCGMTTSFAYMVRGRFLAAAWSQPAGALLALVTAILAGVAVVVMVTGRRLELNWYRINPMRVMIGGIAVFLSAWVFKIVVVLLHR